MTQDYGVTRSRRISGPNVILIIGLVGVVTAGAGLVANSWLYSHNRSVREAQAWSADGPPCPTLSPAALAAQRVPPAEVFHNEDARFARVSGAASCNLIMSDGGRGFDRVPVCMFTSPVVLEIKSGNADVAFGPRLYGVTLVSVPRGQPHCVVVPRSRAASLMAVF